MKTLRITKKSKLSSLLAILLFTLVLLSACQTVPPTAAPAVEKPAEPLKLKIGVTPVPHAQIINFIKDNLAAKNNLVLEVVEFTAAAGQNKKL